jgi:hypothetical protein
MNRITFFPLALLFLLFLSHTPAFCQDKAAENGGFDSIEALIEILKMKGVINEEEATKFIERHKKETEAEEETVITIIPEEKEQEYIEQLSEEVTEQVNQDLKKMREDLDYNTDELLRRSRETDRKLEDLEDKVAEDVNRKLQQSSWTRRIRWGGDVRLRYEGDFFDENNALLLDPNNPDELLNTQTDRHRGRVRVRLAMKAKVMEKNPEMNVGKVDAEFRLVTGNLNNPVSTNETFGRYNNKFEIVLDRAYLKWTFSPDLPIKNQIPEISLTGGRIPNPWFFTDLVWDTDLNFDGIVLNFKTDTQLANPWNGFLTVGAFPLQELEFVKNDKWLYGGQIGIAYEQTMGFSAKLGVAYYDYRNIVGKATPVGVPVEFNFTPPPFIQKGNTLFDVDPSENIVPALASDFKLLNVTLGVDYDFWFPIHIILFGDYVKNLGFDRDDVARRTGNPDIEEETDGYHVGLLVGYPEVRGWAQWNAALAYKYLEADAVLDAFTDSDFALGGTNAKGWILSADFGLHENIWLRGRWLTSNEISGPPLSIDILQIDLNAIY